MGEPRQRFLIESGADPLSTRFAKAILSQTGFQQARPLAPCPTDSRAMRSSRHLIWAPHRHSRSHPQRGPDVQLQQHWLQQN